MKLYKVSQTLNNGYDTYDSMVVCAESEADARTIHPDGEDAENDYNSWVRFDKIDKLEVTEIGEAGPSVPRGVVVASFNAG